MRVSIGTVGPFKSACETLSNLSDAELVTLCHELRQFMIQKRLKNRRPPGLQPRRRRVDGRHTSGCLTPRQDRVVFDVGHQSYVHKILTGRKDRFDTLRQHGGLSGFPEAGRVAARRVYRRPRLGLHIRRARHGAGEDAWAGGDYSVISVIGDGALTGGLSYEGLSDAGQSGEPLIIILNDNGMSITPNVGGIAAYLARQRLKPSYTAFKKRYQAVYGKNAGRAATSTG